MASEFQKKKLMHLFNTFYDYNGDGVIEWVDFEALVDTVCAIHGWTKGDEKSKKCLDTLQTVWGGLRKYADKNADERITPAEWFLMWEECYKNKTALPDWQLSYCNFFFDITDTSGDGVVDIDEYKVVYKGFKFTEKECEEAFNVISANGTNEVTRVAYQKLWTEFVMSDDTNAPGNKLFGAIKN